MHKLILAALVAFASASDAGADTGSADNTPIDRSHALYRMAVHGDTGVRLPADPGPVVESDPRVPGPYARYLMNQGSSKAAAIAVAVRAGEQPGVADFAPARPPVQLTAYETYQIAVQGRAEAEVVANRSGDTQHARSGEAGTSSR